MIDTVKAFLTEGIPIDCVGMEAHLDVKTAPSYNELLDVMKTYAELGVQVQITEFDIQAPRFGGDWTKVSQVATDVLKACVNSPNCTAFNNWGFSQTFYLNDVGKPNSVTMLPWDSENRLSPEYVAIQRVLKNYAN